LTDRFKLSRLVRTVGSEVYIIWEGERRIGQLHVHFAHYTVHVTIILEEDISLTAEDDLLAQIDNDIISSYLPSFEREDMLVTIFRGEEVSAFSYSPPGLDEIDEEDTD
jgi:hypothetical protein